MQLARNLITCGKMNYKGRPPKNEPKLKLSDEFLAKVEQLAENLISNEGMAAYFKISEKGWHAFKKKHQRVDEVIKRGKATCIASCSTKLMAHVQKGNLKAIIFVLTMRGGWTEKSKEQLEEIPEHKAPAVPKTLGDDVLTVSKRYLEIMG